MHGLETIKRMNKEAGDRERQDFANDIIEYNAVVKSLAVEVSKELDRIIHNEGIIQGHKVA